MLGLVLLSASCASQTICDYVECAIESEADGGSGGEGGEGGDLAGGAGEAGQNQGGQ